jgi:hypothetical protein
MALEGNPTLAQAAAEIRAAEGKKLQAGVYRTPSSGLPEMKTLRGRSFAVVNLGFLWNRDSSRRES